MIRLAVKRLVVRALRRLADKAGYKLLPRKVGTVYIDDYPVYPNPRWGYAGRPPHQEITRILERSRGTFSKLLKDFQTYRPALHSIPYEPPDAASTTPFWRNAYFSVLDAASLVCFLLHRTPRRFIEIGSGHSTMFARHAIEAGQLKTTITSIDPIPRAEINAICDRVVRQPLEDCGLEILADVTARDILFLDGSHRVFTNSDVTTFFLDVLPRLPAGVLIHVHDVFLPWDYAVGWSDRFYSEQYLLGAMLLCSPPFRPILPNFFVCRDEALRPLVLDLFKAPTGGRDIPLVYPHRPDIPGVSFWLETSLRHSRPSLRTVLLKS